MKQLKCKKQFGVWYYRKIMPNVYNDLDAPIYELFNKDQEFVATCGCYDEMKYFIETGKFYGC